MHILPDERIHSTRVRLEQLESGSFAATAAMPQEVLAAMTAAHQIISAVDPLPAPNIYAPLEPDKGQNAGAEEVETRIGDAGDFEEDESITITLTSSLLDDFLSSLVEFGSFILN